MPTRSALTRSPSLPTTAAADSTPATVEVGIANRAPVCSDAAPAPADEDTDQTGTLACTDPDLDGLVYGVVAQPATGTVDIDPDTGRLNVHTRGELVGHHPFTAAASDGSSRRTRQRSSSRSRPSMTRRSRTRRASRSPRTRPATRSPSPAPMSRRPRSPITVVSQPVHGTLSGTAPPSPTRPSATTTVPTASPSRSATELLDSAQPRLAHGHRRQRRPGRAFRRLRVRRLPLRARHDHDDAQRSRQRHVGSEDRRRDLRADRPITITAVTTAGRGTASILAGGTALAYDPRGCHRQGRLLVHGHRQPWSARTAPRWR